MVVTIYGEVTRAMADNVRAQLLNNTEPVELRIDSPGGDLLAGLSIYQDLSNHNPTVYIDGMAGSIASVIMLAGSERYISKTGTVAIHNAQQVIMMESGDQNKFKKIADDLQKFSDIIIDVYEQKTNLDRETITHLMDIETLMRSDDAVSAGFATSISEPVSMVAHFNIQNMSLFDKYFKNNVDVKAAGLPLAPGTQNAIEEEEEEEVIEATFTESQMQIIADMITAGISAAVPAQVGNLVAHQVSAIRSEEVPPTQAAIASPVQASFDSFEETMNKINSKSESIYKK